MIGPPAKPHVNGVSLAGRWWPVDSVIWILPTLIKLKKKTKKKGKNFPRMYRTINPLRNLQKTCHAHQRASLDWKKSRLTELLRKLTKAVILLLLTFCLLLLLLWESVIVLCFVVRYFMSILVLQSSWWGRESWLLCLICLPGVSWSLSGSSSWCNGVACGISWSYSLTILRDCT